MMKRLKICCFLGLALLLLTLPVRGAELPPEVERALPLLRAVLELITELR